MYYVRLKLLLNNGTEKIVFYLTTEKNTNAILVNFLGEDKGEDTFIAYVADGFLYGFIKRKSIIAIEIDPSGVYSEEYIKYKNT